MHSPPPLDADPGPRRVMLPVVDAGPPAGFDAGADPLRDRFARSIRYLRVSVTDRCNYRCTYCMPEDVGWRTVRAAAAVLTFEEIERLVGVFAGLGVRTDPADRRRADGAQGHRRAGRADRARSPASSRS